ncbi:MAG: DNA methyltransferase [Nitrososphaerales archaeon]
MRVEQEKASAELSTSSLRVHKLNEEIYGKENLSQDFLDSIQKFGLIQPIVVSRLSGSIVSGSRRFSACMQLGIYIPSRRAEVIYRDFKDELEEEEFLIEANKQRDKTATQIWNEAKALQRIYAERAKQNQRQHGSTAPGRGKSLLFNLNNSVHTQKTVAEKTGLSQGSFAKLEQVGKAADSGNPRAKELLRELDEKKRTIGSAYAVFARDKRRRALNQRVAEESKSISLPETIKFGDAFELIRELPDKSVDAVLTSPPFELDDVDYYHWFERLLEALERVTLDYALVFNSSRRLIEICKRTEPFRILIWDKKVIQEPFRYEPIFVYKFETARYNINDNIWSDLLEWSPPGSGAEERLHPHQNPVGLYDQLAKYLVAERILDPFLGSGTTLRVCNKLGKTCVGFEKDRSMERVILSKSLDEK